VRLKQEQANTNVAFASQGVVAGAGTAGAVLATEQATSEMDQLMIRTNARRQAFGYQVAAANNDFQANNAASRGTSQAFKTLLDTGGKAELDYGRYQAGKKGLGSQEDMAF
jgi:glutamine amidotransferase PdxT